MASIGTPTATSSTKFTVTFSGLKTSEVYDVYIYYGTSHSQVELSSASNTSTSITKTISTPSGTTVEDVTKIELIWRKFTGSGVNSYVEATKYPSMKYGSSSGGSTTPTVSIPSAPSSLTYSSSINSYNSTRITWGSVSGATRYVLERAINGGSFTQVYSGTATSYTDYGLDQNTTRVQYRVKATNSAGSSSYRTGSVSTVTYTKPNTAPTIPSSITVPSTVYGGKSFTVSWGKSTDTDGNLSGYKLEQSTNGGSSWTQVYQGSATSTSLTLTFGQATQVMYRVRAYDTSNAHSDYKVSGSSTVINNKAPNAPPSITVPLTIYGGKTVAVTWTAATDSDGNLSGYLLERSVNSGSYTQIYKGTNKSYTDSITKG